MDIGFNVSTKFITFRTSVLIDFEILISVKELHPYFRIAYRISVWILIDPIWGIYQILRNIAFVKIWVKVQLISVSLIIVNPICLLYGILEQ